MTWARYQSSVGEKCQHQPVGLTCYEAKGSILDEFLKVSHDILTVLDDNKEDLEQGLPTTFSVALEVFMVAEVKARFFFSRAQDEAVTREQARPAIAVITVNKIYRRRALSLLKRNQIIEKLPGFKVVGLQKDPATLMSPSSKGASDDRSTYRPNQDFKTSSSGPSQYPPTDVEDSNWNDIESSLPSSNLNRISLSFDSKKEYLLERQCIQLILPSDKIATLGGMVTFNDKDYGMTVAHAIHGPKLDHDDQPSTLETTVNEGDLNSSDDYEFEELDSQLSTRIKVPLYQWFYPFTSRLSRRPTNNAQGNQKVVLQDDYIKPVRAHIWGRTRYFGQILPKTDFSEKSAPKPSIIPSLGSRSVIQLGSAECPIESRDLDYALFSLESPGEDELTSMRNPILRKEKVQIAPGLSGNLEVIAITSTTGVVTGHLLRRPYFVKMPGQSTNFQLLWAVKLEGRIQPGDCGAWVMSKDSQILYGHLIAADPHSTIAYLVPAYKIFEHISGIPFLHGGPENSVIFSRIFWSSFQLSLRPINSSELPIGPFLIPKTKEDFDPEFVALSKNIHSIISSNVALIGLIYWRDNSVPSLGQINIGLAGLLLGCAILNTIPLFHGPRKAYRIIVLVVTFMTPLAILTASSPDYMNYFPHMWQNIWIFLLAFVTGGHYPQQGHEIFGNLQPADARYGWAQLWELFSGPVSDIIAISTAVYMIIITTRWMDKGLFMAAGDIAQSLHYGLISALTIATVVIQSYFGLFKNNKPYLRMHLQNLATLGFLVDLLREFMYFFTWGFIAWEFGSAISSIASAAGGLDTASYALFVVTNLLGPLYNLACFLGSLPKYLWLITVVRLLLPATVYIIMNSTGSTKASDQWARFFSDVNFLLPGLIFFMVRKYSDSSRENPSSTSQPQSTLLPKSTITSPSALAIVGSVAGCFVCQLYRLLWDLIVTYGRDYTRTVLLTLGAFTFVALMLATILMVVFITCVYVPVPPLHAAPITPQEEPAISEFATI